jgi:RND superfamily putative drug exporter
MDALSRWVTRHRLIVGLLWLAITIVGVVLAPSVSGRLKSGNHLHSAAYTADVQIAKLYGGATSDPGVLTLNLPAGQTVQSPGVQAELKAVDAGLSKGAPTVRIVSFASTGSQTLVGTGGTSTIVLAYPPRDGQDIDTATLDTLTHAAKASAPNLTVHGTSLKALAAGTTSNGGNSTVLGELLIGALGALIVLAAVVKYPGRRKTVPGTEYPGHARVSSSGRARCRPLGAAARRNL